GGDARRAAAGVVARSRALDGRAADRKDPGEAVVTLGELSQRLRRADFVDGLGIYIGSHEVAFAHLSKRLFQVAVRRTATVPLPGAELPAERRQALTNAVVAFTREGGVDTRRTVLCVPRTEAAFNRGLLPAAALENLIPLPRDEIYYDYSARDYGEERLEVLLMCIPREVVRGYLEALEEALVRPRGIVLASTAITDFVTFCRGETGPLGLLVSAPGAMEVTLLSGGRLLSSQLVPAKRLADAAALERSVARQLADQALPAENVPLYRWELANGAAPGL